MPIVRTLVIVVLVWLIGAITDPGRRALAYSVPVPITVVLVATGEAVGAAHVVGVLLLVLFFRVGAWVHHRLGLDAALAGALGTYVAGSLLVSTTGAPPMAVAVAACLGVLLLWTWRDHDPVPTAPVERGGPARLLDPIRGATIVVAASSAALLGGVLGPFVVTFPYSGLPLLVDSRNVLTPLAHGVTRNAFALVGFFVAVRLTQDVADRPWALASGWAAFALVAAALNRPRRAG